MKNAWKILILLIAICGLISCASATSNYNSYYDCKLKIASFDGNISNIDFKLIDYGNNIKNIGKIDVFINGQKVKTFISPKDGWVIPRIYPSTLIQKFEVDGCVEGSNYTIKTFDFNGKQLDTFNGKID
jgi:archaellum component FlaF (FlaF/FlaG flagellin family)